MNENENKAEKILSTDTQGNNDRGNKKETTALIDSANLAAEKLERENKRGEQIENNLKQLYARAALAGKSELVNVKSEDEQIEEQAQKIIKRYYK